MQQNPLKYPFSVAVIAILMTTFVFGSNSLFIGTISDSNGLPVGTTGSTFLRNKLVFSRLLGGSNSEAGMNIVLDKEGDVILSGYTDSNDFPTVNAYDKTLDGTYDAFVAKFAANGTLLWSTFFGGSDWDQSWDVLVDNQNNIIVTGFTQSSDFPMKNAFNATFRGVADVFVAKFTADGMLAWSTLFGGSDWEKGWSIYGDSQDNVIVTGSTVSDDFPVKGAYSARYNGSRDVFIAKLDTAGVILWSTYFGGTKSDNGYSVAIDSHDYILLTGATDSLDFPTLNAFDSTKGSLWDAFVAKFDATGAVLWSTYLGGRGHDDGLAVTADSKDCVIITGSTGSNDFPMVNAHDDIMNGSLDAFVAKFNETGMLQWSRYLGGSDQDFGAGITVDQQDNIVLAGTTRSSDFPLVGAYDSTFHGNEDAFVSILASTGMLQWSTFLGGSDSDNLWGVNVDEKGNILVTGDTGSPDFPLTTEVDFVSGGIDAFVTILVDPKGNGKKSTSNFPVSLSAILFALAFLSAVSALKTRKNCLKSHNQKLL
ncbi:MAG: SBBP repeat-containing protein [Candidatus Heimdallarchaeota archaeon]